MMHRPLTDGGGKPQRREPNPAIDYFPPKEVESSHKALYRLFRKLRNRELRVVMKALQEGRVNGWFVGKDLIGTIASKMKVRDEYLLKRLVFERSSSNPVYYWFQQIGTGETPANNEFVKLTVGWIKIILAKRNRRTRTKRH